MITVYSRRTFQILTQISFNESYTNLIAYDDKFHDDLETGVATYTFSVDKSTEAVENITIGAYIRVLTHDNRKLWFEILDTEEDHDTLHVTAVDAGLDLVGESVWGYEADKGYPIKHYLDKFMLDSGWEVDLTAVGNEKTRKLKYEGFETATKRIRQVAHAFGYEIEFDIEELNGVPNRKVIRFKEQIGQDKEVRLEYGREISNIKKRSSIQKLATALRAHGADGLTLEGYKYNDGRYWVGGDTLHDLQEGARWSRHADINNDGGYVVDTYESEAHSQKTLFDETLLQLKKRAYPEIEYEVEFSDLPEEVHKGDTVLIVDYTFKPALKLKARVKDIECSLSKGIFGDGTVVISNVEYKETTVDERLKVIEKFLNKTPLDFSKVPVVAHIHSERGTVFSNDEEARTTLLAKATRLDIDVTSKFTFKWRRVSFKKDDAEKDKEWNATERTSKRLEITKSDINIESEFFCDFYKGETLELTQSIVLKDLTINKYKGNTAPTTAQSGDFWTDTSTGKEVLKVYVDGKWVDVISDNTAKIDKFKENWEQYNKELADRFTAVIKEIETLKDNEKNTRDLTGRFTDIETAYKQLMEQEQVIKELGQRQKAFELTLEQSSAVISTLGTFFDFSNDGLVVGKKDANTKMVLKNDRIEFMDGGQLTAYMSGQRMFIVSGAFWQSINIGNHTFERLGDEYTIVSYAGSSAQELGRLRG